MLNVSQMLTDEEREELRESPWSLSGNTLTFYGDGDLTPVRTITLMADGR